MERKELSAWECGEIVAALQERHDTYLEEGERFKVEGYRSESEAYAKMTLRNEDNSFVYPVECRIELVPNEIKEESEAMELVLDFQDYYFSRYLREERDLFLPIEWGPFDFDGCTLWARGQIHNLQLEGLADRLLSGELTQEEAEALMRSTRKD